MSILPAPISQEPLPGRFTLPPEVLVTYSSDIGGKVAEFGAARLRERFSRACATQCTFDPEAVGSIHLTLEPLDSLSVLKHSNEAYELTVGEGGVVIRALEPHGLFNGLQSLLLLLPASQPPDEHDISIPGTKVHSPSPTKLSYGCTTFSPRKCPRVVFPRESPRIAARASNS
jgi:hypothetical protein